jgi:hypothetical protein
MVGSQYPNNLFDAHATIDIPYAMATLDMEQIQPVLVLMVEKMRGLELELLAYTAAVLSLKHGLKAGPEIDRLVEEAKSDVRIQAMIAEKYAPLYRAIDHLDEGSLADMLKTWNPTGRAQ